MRAIFNGTVLADSDDIVIVDGNPYFPRSSRLDISFRESSHTTVCGWKGKARCWDVVVGDQWSATPCGLTTPPSRTPSIR